MAVTSTQRSLELLNATFELEELVSSRSTLEVFRARDLRDGSAVWVQRLRPELARRPKELARFETRARSLEALVHRCLPRVCVDTDDSGLPFVVQELVEGRPLADLIGAFPQGVPLPLLAAVIAPVIEALALAHAAGVNHGAIDPAHVMLLGPLHDPSARLVGLDVASHELSVQDKAYRAPELTGAASAGPAADVFACGVLLYQMLSGVLPFQAGTRSALPLDELAPQVPAGFVQLTAACLSEDPRQRPVDAAALYRRLVACCDIAPRRSAANAQATRADTGVHSERAAPKVSGRAPRAGVPASASAARAERAPRAGVLAPESAARAERTPRAGAPASAARAERAPRAGAAASADRADDARRTAPTSHRAEPTPLASERVRKSPTRYADNEAPRTPLSPEHAAELLSAKREASSRSPRMSAPPQAQALRSKAAEPSPRQPQPTAAEASGPPRASKPSGQPVAGASVHPRASQPAAANAAQRASRPSAQSAVGAGTATRSSQAAAANAPHPSRPSKQPAPDMNAEPRASQPAAAGANATGRASPLPAAGAHVESRAKPSGQPAAGASVHPRASQPAAANAAQRASRPSAQPAVGAGTATRWSQASAANAPHPSRPSAVPGDARASRSAAAGEEARSLPPTAAEAGAATRPSRPSAKPAIELSREQLDALAFLRHKYDEEEERDRWVAVLVALLLLLLLSIGAPFFLDSGLAVAHATFGPKLRLAATAFSIATVVGALHPLLARAGRHWFVQRLRGAVTQATALDFVVITSSLYSSAPSITSAANFGQRWLFWGVGLSLLLLALEYLLRGARNLAHDLRYSALIFAMAFLSCFGSYRAVMRALEHEKQRAAQLLARTKQSHSAAESGTNDAQTTSAGDRGVGAQRSGLGDNEAHDLAPAQELEQKHQQDSTAIERLNQKLPAPTQ